MAFLPFVLASFIGRGARFFLVAWLMSWGGEAMEHRLRQYVDYIGWGLVVLVGIAIILSKLD
jgi:membrane protein DedA with SNARE-associated domain